MPDIIKGYQVFDYADGANVVNADGWWSDREYLVLGWSHDEFYCNDAFDILLLKEL